MQYKLNEAFMTRLSYEIDKQGSGMKIHHLNGCLGRIRNNGYIYFRRRNYLEGLGATGVDIDGRDPKKLRAEMDRAWNGMVDNLREIGFADFSDQLISII